MKPTCVKTPRSSCAASVNKKLDNCNVMAPPSPIDTNSFGMNGGLNALTTPGNAPTPVKRAGGRRFYRPDDVDLLRGIRSLLYVDGLTIRGVQKILKERGLRHVAMMGRGQAPAPLPALRTL